MSRHILSFHSCGICLDNRLVVTVLARLNPSATKNQDANRPPNVTWPMAATGIATGKPSRPSVQPAARMYRSCTRRASTTLANMNGKVHAPPSAIKFPATKGDAPIECDAKIGTFTSHPPSTKKYVIADQHIVAITAHCRAEIFTFGSTSFSKEVVSCADSTRAGLEMVAPVSASTTISPLGG